MNPTGPELTWGRRAATGAQDFYPPAPPIFPPAPDGGGGDFIHPFKIVRGSTAGQFQVVGDSTLWDFLGTSSGSVAINYLATDFSISSDQAVWLHGIVASGVLTSAEIVIRSSGPLLAFDSSTPPQQTAFWLLLAQAATAPVAQPATGFLLTSSIWIYQSCFTHLRLMMHCTDGGPAIYPVAA